MDPATAAVAAFAALNGIAQAIIAAHDATSAEAEAKALADVDSLLAAMPGVMQTLTDALAANRAEALANLHAKFAPVVP